VRYLLLLSCLPFVGCYDPHAQLSAVVREVEASGSGNLDFSSQNGIAVYLSNRPELAAHLNQECESLYLNSDAHWAETAEGRVCMAAHNVAPPTNWKADSRTY
jgi:hypothetical protein